MRESKGSLRNVRVLKKNMLFIQSYDTQINKTILNKQSLYRICGQVQKIKVKQNYKNHTAYVTYKNCQAAATAFVAFYHISQRMKILFGTVQYCKYFLRKAECRNDECVFMHLRDKKNQIIVNDQIDEDVYLQHYDMAVRIIQDQAFQTLKRILNKSKEDLSQNLLKKGIIKAAQVFNIIPEAKLEIVPSRKLSSLQESMGSTQEDSISESRQQAVIARPISQKTLKKACIQKDPDPEANSKEDKTENDKSNILKNTNGVCQNKQNKQKDFSLCEYINIQLIKKLVRQNKSKMNFSQQNHQQQFDRSANLMLYKIVKK